MPIRQLSALVLVAAQLIAVAAGTATAAPSAAARTSTGAAQALAPSTAVTAVTGTVPWRPSVGTRWQWQLTGTVNTSVQAPVFDIDGFDTPAATVAALKASNRRTICYISAGSWERWRPDAGKFPTAVLGRSNGWSGERWLDIRRLDVLKPIMAARLNMCKAKGFDAVEPDNVDGYSNNTGFALTYADQLRYNRWLAAAAHARGMSVGLKNDVEQVRDLVAYFDFAINEECMAYAECGALRPFLAAGKAVLHVEYELSTTSFCPKVPVGFSSMRKNWDLDAWRSPCP